MTYCICLLYSPEQIFSDPGFHLSFLATYFMIVFLPSIQHWCRFIPETKIINLRELLVLAFSSPLFMLPYTMYFSGMTPLASPFANILFAIITPPLMFSGLVILVLSPCKSLAMVYGSIISWVGGLVLHVLQLCNHLPHIKTPPLPWWAVVMFYVITSVVLHKDAVIDFVLQQQKMLQQ
jgi:hypothetical protein